MIKLMAWASAAMLFAGCSTVAISEKGSLKGIDVKGAGGQADRTLCVGNEGYFLFNTIPLFSSSMDWDESLHGIDSSSLSLFKNETTAQRLTDAFYKYAERENCDAVDVVVDSKTSYPLALSEFVTYVVAKHELFVTGVLKPRQ